MWFGTKETAREAFQEALRTRNTLTGREVSFGENEIIVSKTNSKGVITYANDVFLRVSGYAEGELVGAPHSILRHPHMPRCVFKVLWDTIETGNEIFAYVLNRNKRGDGYWVLAHVTPTHDEQGRIVGYHSNRRKPEDRSVATIRPIYAALLAEEAKHADRRAATNAGMALLLKTISETGMTYDEFVLSL